MPPRSQLHATVTAVLAESLAPDGLLAAGVRLGLLANKAESDADRRFLESMATMLDERREELLKERTERHSVEWAITTAEQETVIAAVRHAARTADTDLAGRAAKFAENFAEEPA